MKGDAYYHRFFFWLSFFGVAMLILTLADNLMMLFIGWELVGLCSYKLIGFWSQDLANAEAAKKAFMTTRVGDVFMLIGLLIIYAKIGSFGFKEVFAGVQAGQLGGGLLTVAGIGLFMGAVGKSAQFPLQVWLPDAMAGPTPVSALIHAATMVAAGVYLAARMFPIFTPDALQFIAWTGGITAVMAALVAFTQTDIKKVLAYSTISQLGYMMLGVGVGAPWAGMYHLTTHAFFKACLFLGSGSVIHAMHHAQDLKDMGGLRKKMPITFWTFIVATLALAGIPLMSGFYSKDAILFTALRNGQYLLFALGFFGAFLTAFYMTRMVWLCFFGEPRNKEKYDHAHESPLVMTVPLVILAFLSLGPVFTDGPLLRPVLRDAGARAALPGHGVRRGRVRDAGAAREGAGRSACTRFRGGPAPSPPGLVLVPRVDAGRRSASPSASRSTGPASATRRRASCRAACTTCARPSTTWTSSTSTASSPGRTRCPTPARRRTPVASTAWSTKSVAAVYSWATFPATWTTSSSTAP